jgi:heme oxygenase
MAESSWMLARLKRETFVHHASADGDRLSLLTTDGPGYVWHVSRIFGFESPFEAAFATTPQIADVLEVRARTKIRLLKADLGGLGVLATSDLPRFRITPFRDIGEALGWLYVVERNSLLHGVIHRHLSQRIPEQLRDGGSYVSFYEHAAHARWRDLGIAIDRAASTAQISDRIVASANEAFRAQRHWYDAVPPRSEATAY